MRQSPKTVIGWKELVDLPDWGIHGMRAKIDTGAKSCSLHVEDIEEHSHGKISFVIVMGKGKRSKRITATPHRIGHVKSSIGVKTSRWYVETVLRIGDHQQWVKVNLVGREGMNFRMLVGRTAIESHFLVDVSKGYQLSKKKKKA